MEKTVLPIDPWAVDHKQVIFQTYPVRKLPHRPSRADEIPKLVEAIHRSGVVVDVVMNVLAVCVDSNEKGTLALCSAHQQSVVVLIGGNQFASLHLVQVVSIVKSRFQGLSDDFILADLVFFEIDCGRRQYLYW